MTTLLISPQGERHGFFDLPLMALIPAFIFLFIHGGPKAISRRGLETLTYSDQGLGAAFARLWLPLAQLFNALWVKDVS